MIAKMDTHWREIIRLSIISGVTTLSLALVGMIEVFSNRDIIGNVLSLDRILLFAPVFGAGFLFGQSLQNRRFLSRFLGGVLIGVGASLPLIVLVVMAGQFDLRQFLINVSPGLIELLSFGQAQLAGAPFLMLNSALLGSLGAVLTLLDRRFLRPLFFGLGSIVLIGLLSEIIILAWGNQGTGLLIRRYVFAARGLSLLGAGLVFLIITGAVFLWDSNRDRVEMRINALPQKDSVRLRFVAIGFGLFLLLVLPTILRTYLTEVIDNVAIYILMGLGLNIVVGFAGLLDLGYVAFFAIGAYTMGVLTTTSDLGIAGLSFWQALPISVIASVFFGVILGIPVLRMRGDYLAIVTLGFGEIIRILALSNALSPIVGGAQGILKIPKPQIGGQGLVSPESLYYLLLAAGLLALFISWRLRDSRLGRQWMAMREDEDVAEAMGINLVTTKLLAFAIGAGFSGLSGAIFASKIGSIFPASFNLLVSINVLSLIIVGGMGSLPGVIIGALVLIGLPELLREFAEYRLFLYGALLVAMMLLKPEGFWPSAIHQRELHTDQSIPEPTN